MGSSVDWNRGQPPVLLLMQSGLIDHRDPRVSVGVNANDRGKRLTPVNMAPVIAAITPIAMPPTALPMMPWFPDWFFSLTRGWTVTQRGIFQQLYDSQWVKGGLPSDPASLKQLLGATSSEWKSWPVVEPQFPIGSDGLRRNVRLEADRTHALELSARHRRGAAITNIKRRDVRVDRHVDVARGDVT
jgi:uncharacterized protein YdaU (DUF1376 family)